MGAYLDHDTIDKGLSGGETGTAPTVVGMCHFYCNTIEDFQAGFGPHAAEILADIPNDTDLEPALQFSEVIVAGCTHASLALGVKPPVAACP